MYAKLLQDIDVPFTEPLKVAGPTVEKAAKEAARLGEPKPVQVDAVEESS